MIKMLCKIIPLNINLSVTFHYFMKSPSLPPFFKRKKQKYLALWPYRLTESQPHVPRCHIQYPCARGDEANLVVSK